MNTIKHFAEVLADGRQHHRRLLGLLPRVSQPSMRVGASSVRNPPRHLGRGPLHHPVVEVRQRCRCTDPPQHTRNAQRPHAPRDLGQQDDLAQRPDARHVAHAQAPVPDGREHLPPDVRQEVQVVRLPLVSTARLAQPLPAQPPEALHLDVRQHALHSPEARHEAAHPADLLLQHVVELHVLRAVSRVRLTPQANPGVRLSLSHLLRMYRRLDSSTARLDRLDPSSLELHRTICLLLDP
eukprot:9618726-Heterocapsa_arctica.AAC.1